MLISVHKASIVLIVLGLTGCVAATGANKDKHPCSDFLANYLSHLTAAEIQVEITNQSVAQKTLYDWKDFLEPTFPVGLDFGDAVRVVIAEKKQSSPIAIFIFRTPADFKTKLPTFERFSASGILRSEVQTYYTAIANNEMFVILLSEQKRIPSNSPLLISLMQTLDAAK